MSFYDTSTMLTEGDEAIAELDSAITYIDAGGENLEEGMIDGIKEGFTVLKDMLEVFKSAVGQ